MRDSTVLWVAAGLATGNLGLRGANVVGEDYSAPEVRRSYP